MSRLLAVALALGACMMLPSGSEAQPNQLNVSGQAMEFARTNTVILIKSDKQKQKDANKECGPNKVFVEGRCVKRENAEKRQEKAKEQKEQEEKAKQTQTPPPPPPAVKRTCCTVGANPYKYCADTENEAYLKAQATMVGQINIKPINCGPAN